jgi:hypothetical protein
MNEIVNVSGNSRHCHEPDGDVEAGQPWELTWQQRRLNPPRRFELTLYNREVGLRSEHRPQDDIAKAQDEDQHSNRLDVRARHDNLPGVFIDDERAEHSRAEDDDAVRQVV